MEGLELKLGDWELDATDPLSQEYESKLEKGFTKLVETLHYIYDLYFGKEEITREQYGLIN